jgi:hypothetical protein
MNIIIVIMHQLQTAKYTIHRIFTIHYLLPVIIHIFIEIQRIYVCIALTQLFFIFSFRIFITNVIFYL